jgi:hypothetical protein
MTMVSDPEEPTQPTSHVSKAAGGTFPLLPGESSTLYEQGYEGALKELGATTELQIFLVEKIFQCIWWMRRYETQKRSAILAGMVRELTNYTATADQKNAIRQLIFGEMWDEDVTQNLFKKSGHTTESLLEAAMSNRKDELNKLDQQIALRTKTLMQLQQSYEALVNRSILNERLKQQNALIKRDLQAIDVEEVKQLESSKNGKPQAKSRK